MRQRFEASGMAVKIEIIQLTARTLMATGATPDTQTFHADAKTLSVIAIALVVAALANAVGVGGGIFWVPLFNSLLGFSLKGAAALSQACVACGTVGSTCYSLRQPHPGDAHKPMIDFDLALVLTPALLLGITSGVLLNIMLPSLVLFVVLAVVLVGVGARTLQQALRLHGRERAASQAALIKELPAVRANRAEPHDASGSLPFAPAPRLVWPGREQVLALGKLAAVWAVYVSFQVAKSFQHRCSWQYGVLFGAQAAVLLLASAFFMWTHNRTSPSHTAASTQVVDEEHLPPPQGAHVASAPPRFDASRVRLLVAWLLVLSIGVLGGTLGLGGGVLLSPLLVELQLNPQTAASTSSLMVLFAATGAALVFGLDGLLNLSYVAVYGPVCLVGGFVGVFLLTRLVHRYSMASLITFLLSGLIFASCGLAAGFAGRYAIQDVAGGEAVAVQSLCTT